MQLLSTKRSTCSGSIMAEACIGLALMVFAWIMITYTLFMANNQTRTAMAARHAAWFKGEAQKDITADQLDSSFFYQPGLSKVTYVKGEGIVSSLAHSPSGDKDEADAEKKVKDTGAASAGPFKAMVSFGITTNEISSTDKFPFALLKTKVPFMPDSRLETGLSVASFCQWEVTSETWIDRSTAFSGMFGSLMDIVTDLVVELVTP